MPPSPAVHPSVRAVVVSWNGAHLLRECLDSLEAQTIRDELEIVVVDNASTDTTAALLAEQFPGVRHVRAERNLGFAGGAALGMRDLDAPWVVLLNNDATFAPDAVEQLRAALTRPGAERVGAATAKILLAGLDPRDGGRHRVNSTGNLVTRRGTGADRDWAALDGQESTDPDVFGFCGGAAMLRRAAVDEVGGFDPRLFLYYEDTDLSWKLRAAGHDVLYVREAEVEHLHSASSGTSSPLFRYQNTRNSLIVVTRHAPALMVLTAWSRQIAGLVRCALRGPRGELSPRVRGVRDALRRLPRTLAERRRIWSTASRSRREALNPGRTADTALP